MKSNFSSMKFDNYIVNSFNTEFRGNRRKRVGGRPSYGDRWNHVLKKKEEKKDGLWTEKLKNHSLRKKGVHQADALFTDNSSHVFIFKKKVGTISLWFPFLRFGTDTARKWLPLLGSGTGTTKNQFPFLGSGTATTKNRFLFFQRFPALIVCRVQFSDWMF